MSKTIPPDRAPLPRGYSRTRFWSTLPIVFRGKDPDEVNERFQRRFFPENALVWFWLLAPLLLPFLVSIYYLFLMLLMLMVGFVLRKRAPGVADTVAHPLVIATTIVAWGFELYSMGLIWYSMRNQRWEQLRRRASGAGETK
jgi:hypothetical protein